MTNPKLRPLGTYETGIFDESAAEIPAYDPNTQRVFVVKANEAAIDVLDISDPTNPTLINQIDVSPFGAIANSVAVNQNSIVAVAIEADIKQDPGTVAFFNTDGEPLNSVTVGALPDMLTFTSDGTKVLVANEGEPNDDYSNDPEGSVSIIDISGGVDNLTQADVSTADFSAFIGREEELRNKGVRIYGPGSNAAQDLEPEFIAVSGDDTTAFVTLQENNAVAVVDINNANIVDILPLGVKDYSRGLPTLTEFEFSDLPLLDTTEGGQEIILGGLSGLWFEGEDEDGNLQFVTVPDRGPNGAPTDVDNDGANERPFALPDYQARILRFTLDESSGDIEITDQIFLTRQDGDETVPITGLPNIPGVDEEPVDLFGNPLEYDPFGADLEGIVINDDGTYWTVDEYRPAIYHFETDGTLIDRFVPEGTAALAEEAVGTFGTESLPAEYSNRRPNRGFEAIALDTDADILYSFIQTPLENPDRAASDNSSVIRMLGIDPDSGEPVAEYVYLLEKPTLDPSDGTLLVDKMGDAVYTGDGKFLVLERDSSVTATGKKFIFEIDLNGATNLLANNAPELPNDRTLEQLTADELAGLDIQAVNKTKVTNLPSIGYIAGDKVEGLSLLPDGRLAVLNDNDFGLLDQQIPIDGTVPLNPDPVPVVLGVIDFSQITNQIDPSDRDGGINLGNWPVSGLLLPDSIASFVAEGQTYYITADEGDDREYDGLDEAARVGDEEYVLDDVFDVAALEDDAAIGRLTVTNQNGDLDGDGDFDKIFTSGGRSFSIWDAAGNQIFNSGDSIEKITADLLPDNFNSDRDENTFDTRSDNGGPEPEALTTGVLDDKTYAFLGLERIGGIMVYDVSNPTSPDFVQYINNRDFSVEFDVDEDGDPDPTPEQLSAVGDLAPEGLVFISPEDSPNGEALLVVANEISGTTTVYEFSPNQTIQGTPGNNNLRGDTGNDNINGLGGNDTLSGLGGNDTVIGGAGDDTINGNRGNDRVIGGDGDDFVNGGYENDTIFGGNGDDILIGRLGNDRLLGGNGDDTLDAGIGRDRLNGGSGDDLLTGGASIDYFIFAAPDEFSDANLGVDEITDFNPGQDLILLDLRVFAEITTVPGEGIDEDEFAIVGSNAAAGSSDAQIVYNSNNGALFYNANGSASGLGDGGQFAILTDAPTLTSEDFVIR